MNRPLRFGAIGLDHRHVFHLVGENIAAGAQCAGYCPATSDPRVVAGFRERFPELRPVERERLFEDPTIDFIVSAAVPRDRPAIAVRAMQAGKDVMVDKPGATSLDQLTELERVGRQTGRTFSIRVAARRSSAAGQAACPVGNRQCPDRPHRSGDRHWTDGGNCAPVP